MTSHSIFSSFFFSTNAFHHVPFCGLKSTYTQSSRSGKLRGEGRVYWKRRAASLWERPEVEGHTNQATALFRPLRPTRGTAAHACRPECTLCLFGVRTCMCVCVHKHGPTMFWVSSSSSSAAATVSESRQSCMSRL